MSEKFKEKLWKFAFLAGFFMVVFLANLIFIIPKLLGLMDDNNHKKPF